jgi:hypothetical protein
MKRLVLPGLACALIFLTAVGCGPMKAPLPARLDPETQKKIDESWDRAFAPADRLGHQDLLDVMVGTQAYQLGVDTFSLRAEKRFAGGKVVMEVGFDRARPNDDRFEVTVYDPAGKLVRAERYTRQEVEDTYHALFGNSPERADHAARWEKIRNLFPEVKDEPKDGKPAAPMPRAKG